ncbi:MAG: HEAT repeat domain-containing protein [Halobacteriota archaeon]
METPGAIDFTLVFAEGHKIVCEAKDRKEGLREHILKAFVKNLYDKEKEAADAADEILVITSLCSIETSETFKQIEALRFYPQEVLEDELAKKGYEREHGQLLSKLRLWQQPKSVLEDLVYLLFSQVIGFWLPQDDIEDVVRSILLKVFHWGSAEGIVYKREDMEREIQSQASKAKDRSTIFNAKLTSYEKQIDKIDAAARGGNLGAGDSEITALSQDPALMYLLLDKLKVKHDLKLADWTNVWHACKIYYPLQLFDVFRANIANKANRRCILSFVESNLDQLNTFYFDTFFESGLAKLLTAIVEKDSSLHQAVLSILKKQFEKYDEELFYLNADEDKLHRKSDLCNTLESLYQKSTKDAKEQIYEFIINTFNVIGDEGNYSRYAPREIFRILKHFLNDNNNEFFEHRFLAMSSKLATQYEKFYRQKFRCDFEGWDLIGPISAVYGHDYEVPEKQFILCTLIPALRDFNCETRWSFIKQNCVVEPTEVSKNRPDFLNRIAIPFVLDEYKKGNQEASEILGGHLLSGRHVSDNAEFVYQILKTGKFTDDQKWEAVKITAAGGPVNPFVDQVVGDLAFMGHKQAIAQIEAWASNPGYLEYDLFFNGNLIPNVEKLLCHDSNRATSIFKKLVANESFIKRLNQIQVREFCALFARIIVKRPNEGWTTWNDIKNKDFLTINEQQLLAGTLHDLHNRHSRKALERAFSAANALTANYDLFVTKFSFSHSRELLVQFVTECAAKDKENPIPSFELIERFVSDPDPSNEKDIDVANANVMVIGTVRGYAAWAISSVVRSGIEGKVDEVIALVRSLTRDRNLHVRQLSCLALARLAENRNAKANGMRFMSEGQANEVEAIAFEMLEKEENKRQALQVAMADVFNRLRSVDLAHATKAVNIFVEADVEALKKYLGTIICFAELRRDFSPEEKLPFKDLLCRLIERDSATKSTIAWHMWSLSHAKSSAGESYLSKTLKYVRRIVERYDQSAYDSIYSLVKDNFNNANYQNELLSIYKKCIAAEKEYLTTHLEYPKRISAPYYANGDMLEMIFTVSKKDFVDIFKELLEYPQECYIGDIGNAVDLLFKTPKPLQHDVGVIFQSLIGRYPTLRDKQRQWEQEQ